MTDDAALRWLCLSGIAGIIGAILWTLGDALIVGARAQVADYPLLFKTYVDRIEPELAAMMVPAGRWWAWSIFALLISGNA